MAMAMLPEGPANQDGLSIPINPIDVSVRYDLLSRLIVRRSCRRLAAMGGGPMQLEFIANRQACRMINPT
jgi:hypothetical protein